MLSRSFKFIDRLINESAVPQPKFYYHYGLLWYFYKSLLAKELKNNLFIYCSMSTCKISYT